MRPTFGRHASASLIGLGLFALTASADDPATAGDSAGVAPAAQVEVAASAPDPLGDEALAEDYATELGELVPDPFEPVNRRFFRFNDALDQYVIVPVTDVYQLVIPSPLRVSFRRFFRNIKSPIYFVNNLLQLRFRDAAETAAAFALNSTAGFVGLFDPGSEVGWNQHPADFGQTLGMFGVMSGPYLVIPLLGPSTVRDGAGDIVDRAFDPLTYLFGVGDLLFIGGSSGFVTREEHSKGLAALRGSSVDYYAAMRSAYTQNRESHIAALRARLGWGPKQPETTAAR